MEPALPVVGTEKKELGPYPAVKKISPKAVTTPTKKKRVNYKAGHGGRARLDGSSRVSRSQSSQGGRRGQCRRVTLQQLSKIFKLETMRSVSESRSW